MTRITTRAVARSTPLRAGAAGELDGHYQDAHLCVQTQEILMAIYESARTHSLVQLPLATQSSPLVEMVNSGALPVRYPGWHDIRHGSAIAPAKTRWRELVSAEPLRAVVVGGHIGRTHAHGYMESNRTDLVAVCDMDPATLEEFADEFDVERRYTDYETMLREEQPDLLSIGTPQQHHAWMTILAATRYAPRAIVCEKPMASSTGQGYAMLAACERNGVKLAIGHQGRWMPRHEQVRQLIADGAIGNVLTAFAGPPKPDAGLMNIATHQLSYWQFMLGDPTPLWVLANVQRQTDRFERSWPAEDLAGLLVEFEGGVRLSMESDTPPEGIERDLRVITGTEGVIWLSGGNGRQRHQASPARRLGLGNDRDQRHSFQ